MNKSRLRLVISELAWQAGPPLTYGVLMLRIFPYWRDFSISSDEGYNLMKAMMMVKGYFLYSQIWSDQPPFLTYLLAWLYQLRGFSVYSSRLLILAFSCLLVWSVVQFLRLAWGKTAALLVGMLLILVPYFPLLSAAVMVGQPSLAMACVSLLFLTAWHRKPKGVFLIFSALAFSLSIMTKLFTAPIAITFVIGLVAAQYAADQTEQSLLQLLLPALLWSVTFIAFTAIAGIWLSGTQNISELFQPHLAASQASVYPPNEQLLPITYYLLDAWPIMLLALFGVVFVLQQRRWLMLYPLAWMLSSVVELLALKPVWYHHQLLITIPAAIFAAVAAGETFHAILDRLRRQLELRQNRILIAGSLVSLVLVGAFRVPDTYTFFRQQANADATQRHPFEDKLLKKIDQYAPQTNWMLTDSPMFAFRSGVKVPPNLVVISWKRLAAGDLNEKEILNSLLTLKPEQVLFTRFQFNALNKYLADNYDLVLEREDNKTRLYIRKDLRYQSQ
jgi:4-amino-4-deoxy-L-arabinose transferase-like glycosyltransferase